MQTKDESEAIDVKATATNATVGDIFNLIDSRIQDTEGVDHINLVKPDNSKMVILRRNARWVSTDEFAPRAMVIEKTFDNVHFGHGTLVPSGDITLDHAYIIFQRGEGVAVEQIIVKTFEATDWKDGGKNTDEVSRLNGEGQEQIVLSEEEARNLKRYIEGLESLGEESRTLEP